MTLPYLNPGIDGGLEGLSAGIPDDRQDPLEILVG